MSEKKIPIPLQELVYWSVNILGEAIKVEYGESAFKQIESLRRRMKAVRGKKPIELFNSLDGEWAKLRKEKTERLYAIAHSYAVMLELINRCESTYRISRLEGKPPQTTTSRPHAIIFVFTAHPTEARSEAALALFRNVQETLLRVLNGSTTSRDELYHLLMLILKIPLGKNIRPSVEDEARHIFNTVLRTDILQEQIELKKRGIVVHFRTWVGGDKDGHPGVDEKSMLMSWQISRTALLQFVRSKLILARKHFQLTKGNAVIFNAFERKLFGIEKIKAGDGKRLVTINKELQKLNQAYSKYVGAPSPDINSIIELFWLYPALLVPLEVREDSELVHAASKNNKAAIARMLKTLSQTAKGHDPKWYVRGFVLSMVESSKDLIAGFELSKKILGTYAIPVVPLFENAHALNHSVDILKNYFKQKPEVIRLHQKKWSGRFETMVGYSDSSKESGVFPSRWLIRRSILNTDKFLRQQKLTPVFFHGSGGSVERGGGSIKEQTQWWPKSAVDIFKATTQGEMVARNFSSAMILRSQVEKIAGQAARRPSKGENDLEQALLTKFNSMVAKKYQDTVASDDFFAVVEKATPYHYLDVLKIGSRPSKRQVGIDKRKLRAIPWVLCWTQTRLLFPTWWGIGHAWSQLSKSEKQAMRELYKNNDLLSSFCKSLGFTLAKVELGVWRFYLERAELETKNREQMYLMFVTEYDLACKFLEEVSGEKNLLWYRPWLGESIFFRSAMIHPLNIIQVEALRRKDDALLRETVTGIACGMLTTG